MGKILHPNLADATILQTVTFEIYCTHLGLVNERPLTIRLIYKLSAKSGKNQMQKIYFLPGIQIYIILQFQASIQFGTSCKNSRTTIEWSNVFSFKPSTEENNEKVKFLFVYQADWMKRLLVLYGQEMCLMDATYRTCRYKYTLILECTKVCLL